jgi:hypothetical protein
LRPWRAWSGSGPCALLDFPGTGRVSESIPETLIGLSAKQLYQAASLWEKIEALEADLAAILGGAVPGPSKRTAAPATTKKRKRTMSPEARAKIAAAQKARWDKQKSAKKAK